MSLSVHCCNHSASAEMYRQYQPGAILAYRKLNFMSRLMHPTILSAFKAGLLGKRIPLLPFKIEIITQALPYPILCVIDPSSPTWDKDACSQVEKILQRRSIGILNQSGKSLSSLGLDQIWTTRYTSVYRAEVVQQRMENSPTGSSDLFSTRRRLVSANGVYTDDYVDAASAAIENRLVEELSKVLQSNNPSEWPSLINELKSQKGSLKFVSFVVYNDAFVHSYDKRCFSQALVNCGFKMPLLFVRKMARLFANALESLYGMIISSGCRIKHAILVSRLNAQLRAYKIGLWMRSVRDSVMCPPIHRCEVYSSSSSDDDDRDVAIFDRFSSCGGQYIADSIDQTPTIFLGRGIEEGSGFFDDEEEEPIGIKLRASNVVSSGPVSFSLLRRDAFVKKIKAEGVQFILDRKSDQKFSRAGTTLVEPGDLIRVDIRKKSAEPIDPSKKRTSRAVSFMKRGFRSVRRSLSPNSSSKEKPTRSNAPDQWVRLDWVVYEKSKIRKGSESEWHIVQSYRLKREEMTYEAPGFVVPLQVDVRYAVLIYQNAIGSGNQWIYKGMRVFDIDESYNVNKYRTVPFNKTKYLQAQAAGKLGEYYHPSLSRGRYLGFAPFLRKLPGTQTIIDYFPVSLEDPKKRNTGNDCLLAAWNFFDSATQSNNYEEKSQKFAQMVVYLKMERIANVVYALGDEKTVPFPMNNNRRMDFDKQIKDEEARIPEMNAEDCASIASAKSVTSLPEEETPYDSGEETNSSDDSAWLTGMITRDFTSQDNKIPLKKGDRVLVNSKTSNDGKVYIYYDFEPYEDIGYVPQDVVSVSDQLPGWKPELVSEPIGRLFGDRYGGGRYSNSLRFRREKNSRISKDVKLRSLIDLGYLTEDKPWPSVSRSTVAQKTVVPSSSAPQSTPQLLQQPPRQPLQQPPPTPNIITDFPPKQPNPNLAASSSSSSAKLPMVSVVDSDDAYNQALYYLAQEVSEIQKNIKTINDQYIILNGNSTDEEKTVAKTAAVAAENGLTTAWDNLGFQEGSITSNKIYTVFFNQNSDYQTLKRQIDESTNKANEIIRDIFPESTIEDLLNDDDDDESQTPTPLPLQSKIGECWFCEKAKREAMQKTGGSAKEIRALIACDLCGGKNKSKESHPKPVGEKMKCSDKMVDFEVYLENGTKEPPISMKKGKTFADLKKKFFKNPKYHSFEKSHSLVLKSDQSDPGQTKVEDLPSKDLLFIDKKNITMQRGGPSADVIASMLESASNSSFSDFEEDIGFDLSKHGSHSIKVHGGGSTTFMGRRGLNQEIHSNNMVIASSIDGSDESLIGMNRNVLNETPISTDHVLKRCVQVTKNRKAKGDMTDYMTVLTELSEAFDAFHCINSNRVLIFRRTVSGSCREGLLAAIRIGEVVSIGSKVLNQKQDIPAMAYDTNALYFFRMAMDPIDNDAVFEQVLDNAREFIFALGFIVLKSDTPMTQEEMQAYAKQCYEKNFPKKEKSVPPPPLPRCDYETFWEKLMTRRSVYTLPSGFRDAILEPGQPRTFNQTYGSLQGLPNAIGFSIGSGQSSERIGAGADDFETNEEGTGGFSDLEGGGWDESGYSGGFMKDFESIPAKKETIPSIPSSSSLAPSSSSSSSPATPASSREMLKKAQTGLNQTKDPALVTLTVVLNNETFMYDPLGKISSSSQNYKTKGIIVETMNLRDVLQAFSEAIWDDYNIDASPDCMIVRVDSISNPVVSKGDYYTITVNNTRVFRDPSHITLVIKNGNDVNSRSDGDEEEGVKNTQPSSDSNGLVNETAPQASASTSIMDQLLGETVGSSLDKSNQTMIGCSYLEEEYKNFHFLWNSAVADRSGQFFAKCPEHQSPIFSPNAAHLMVIPKPTLFSKWCQLLKRGEAKFTEFVKSRTFMLPSGFTSHSRTQVVRSVDGKHCLNIKYKFKPSRGQHCVRVNDQPWIPIRQLHLGENQNQCQVYAIPYDSTF